MSVPAISKTTAPCCFDLGEKFAPYTEMAIAIFEITRENDCCSASDLLRTGFSEEDLMDYWHMANAIATVELRLMNG